MDFVNRIHVSCNMVFFFSVIYWMYLSYDFALIVKFLHDFVFQGCPDDDEDKIEYAARIYTKYFGSLVSFSTLNQPLFVYDLSVFSDSKYRNF